ncbi:MFS transporter [Sphingorhabdus sp. IMCC26285]|uniref:MFS transporter n=1 Tax=Sphingorhabdus profundilacus TaxID=2509718 RepID=A0A6I4M344_9SPHN|nr:NnrU family protein [Sphingorhabdus profundilacus]MVZ96888.1 MFS transporter [Sphingorhabdus profundilacus]
MNEYLLLVFACVSFVGTHFLMSHPWRATLVRGFGANGFLLAYSAVSLALFVWMVIEFGRAPKADLFWPVSDIIWAVASVLTLLAAILFAGSFIRNPSLPGMPDAMAAQTPSGVFKVTRHPMMWGFALWAMAHILVAPRTDNFIFSGSILFLALVGSKGQEIKKLKLTGVEWEAWLRRTHFWPRLSALLSVGLGPWIAGVVLWLAATWSHPYMGVAGAGIFRWLAV